MLEVCDSAYVSQSRLLEYFNGDPAANLFAIYDLLNERENTNISLAMEEDKIVGYLPRYSGLSYQTAIIRGLRPAVARLLDELRGQKMVLFVDSDALAMLDEKLNPTTVIEEDLLAACSGSG